jgi:hypothetical protein
VTSRRSCPWRRTALAGLLAATLLAGCGTSSDRLRAGGVAQRFYSAAAHGDGRTACAQLSPDTRAQLVKDEQVPSCPKAVAKLTLHGGRVAVVRVYATSAEVQLAGGDTVFLGAGAHGWRIDAVGCHPRGDGTFDCEEQA